jgi:Right handed beta helix region
MNSRNSSSRRRNVLVGAALAPAVLLATLLAVDTPDPVSAAPANSCRVRDKKAPGGFRTGTKTTVKVPKTVIRNGKRTTIQVSKNACILTPLTTTPGATTPGTTAGTTAGTPTSPPATATVSTPATAATGPITAIPGGRLLFFAPTGNDANPGTAASPKRTPPPLKSKDTFVFRAGLYSLYSFDVSDVANVRLLAFPGDVPIFDGGGTKSHFVIFRENVSDFAIKGLTITGYDDQYGNGAIVGVGNIQNIMIEENVFDRNGTDPLLDHHIYLGGGSSAGRLNNWTIRRNKFLNPSAGAIHSYGTNGATNVIVEENRFLGGKWGVLISDEGQTNWEIRNNSFAGMNTAAISLDQAAKAARADVKNIRLSKNVITVPAGKYALRVDQPQVASGALVDLGNVFWASGSAIVLWNYPAETGREYNLAGYREVSGQGAQSQEIDPVLSEQLTVSPTGPLKGFGSP